MPGFEFPVAAIVILLAMAAFGWAVFRSLPV